MKLHRNRLLISVLLLFSITLVNDALYCQEHTPAAKGTWAYEPFLGARLGGWENSGEQNPMAGVMVRRLFGAAHWSGLHAGAYIQSLEGTGLFTIHGGLDLYLISHSQNFTPSLLFGIADQFKGNGKSRTLIRLGLGFEQKIGKRWSIPFRFFEEFDPDVNDPSQSVYATFGICFR